MKKLLFCAEKPIACMHVCQCVVCMSDERQWTYTLSHTQNVFSLFAVMSMMTHYVPPLR